MKKVCAVLVVLLIVSLMFTACGNQDKVKSELIGTFQYVTLEGTRTIFFKGNGVYYEVIESIFGDGEDTGTYKLQKGKLILNSDKGYTHTWTYDYNTDNGNLVLYFNDWAYTKIR